MATVSVIDLQSYGHKKKREPTEPKTPENKGIRRRAEGGVREEKDGGGMEETKGKGTVKEKRMTETCGFHCKGLFPDWSPSMLSSKRHNFCTRILMIPKYSLRSDLTNYKPAQARMR